MNKEERLIWELYKKNNNLEEATYILEKNSLIEDETGIKFILKIPIIEWNENGKIPKVIKRTILITKEGKIEILSEERKQEINNLENFLDNSTYKIEKCCDDLTRITKEENQIHFKIEGNTLKKERITTPTIFYLNQKEEVVYNSKKEEKAKVYTK